MTTPCIDVFNASLSALIREIREWIKYTFGSDIIDITSYSEVDTRNKIDAFIETLESIRANKAA